MNENLIDSLKGIEKFSSLKDLQINFNFIEKIEFLDKLNLEKLWINENKIQKIENLPINIKSFWVATNLISELDNNLLLYDNLSDLNLSANLLSSFKDLYFLSQMKSLEILNLNDPNFGENPICLINNYRLYLLHKMPYLKILDEIAITKEEKEEYANVYLKKSSFYKNKIKQLNRFSKLSFILLKTFGWFFKFMKFLQIFFFRKRIKMLQYIQYERICQNFFTKNLNNSKTSSNNLDKSIIMNDHLNQEQTDIDKIDKITKSQTLSISETHKNTGICEEAFLYINSQNYLSENITKDEIIEEMNKEIEITNDKVRKCITNFQMIDFNYYHIKNYISEVNDFSIIW